MWLENILSLPEGSAGTFFLSFSIAGVSVCVIYRKGVSVRVFYIFCWFKFSFVAALNGRM